MFLAVKEVNKEEKRNWRQKKSLGLSKVTSELDVIPSRFGEQVRAISVPYPEGGKLRLPR